MEGDHEKVDDSRKVDERKSKEQDYHMPLCRLSGCVLYKRISVHHIVEAMPQCPEEKCHFPHCLPRADPEHGIKLLVDKFRQVAYCSWAIGIFQD